MGHFVGTAVTAAAAKALHAGPNVAIAGYTLSETASGSTTIDVLPLPGGSRVTHVRVAAGDIGTGAETLYIADTLGNAYFATATAGFDGTFKTGANTGFGERLTGSANLRITIGGAVGTGTSQTALTVIAEYITEDEPD